jgi:hypothetical protein
LSLSCDHCLEIWEPQPPGTLRACPGLLWDCFYMTLGARNVPPLPGGSLCWTSLLHCTAHSLHPVTFVRVQTAGCYDYCQHHQTSR